MAWVRRRSNSANSAEIEGGSLVPDSPSPPEGEGEILSAGGAEEIAPPSDLLERSRSGCREKSMPPRGCVECWGGSMAVVEMILLLLSSLPDVEIIISVARREWGEPAVTRDQESVVVETESPGEVEVEVDVVGFDTVVGGGGAGAGGGADETSISDVLAERPAERPRRCLPPDITRR